LAENPNVNTGLIRRQVGQPASARECETASKRETEREREREREREKERAREKKKKRTRGRLKREVGEGGMACHGQRP